MTLAFVATTDADDTDADDTDADDTLLPPRPLLAYRPRSAARSRCSIFETLSYSCAASTAVTPTLAVKVTGPACVSTGHCTYAWRNLCATRFAPATLVSGRTIMNSSPPTLAS